MRGIPWRRSCANVCVFLFLFIFPPNDSAFQLFAIIAKLSTRSQQLLLTHQESYKISQKNIPLILAAIEKLNILWALLWQQMRIIKFANVSTVPIRIITFKDISPFKFKRIAQKRSWKNAKGDSGSRSICYHFLILLYFQRWSHNWWKSICLYALQATEMWQVSKTQLFCSFFFIRILKQNLMTNRMPQPAHNGKMELFLLALLSFHFIFQWLFDSFAAFVRFLWVEFWWLWISFVRQIGARRCYERTLFDRFKWNCVHYECMLPPPPPSLTHARIHEWRHNACAPFVSCIKRNAAISSHHLCTKPINLYKHNWMRDSICIRFYMYSFSCCCFSFLQILIW